MAFEISRDPARLDVELIHRELAASYWSSGVRRDVVVAAIRGSRVVGAYAPADRGGVQLGFARLVTDGATFAWLCDVFVVEAARGQGVATALVRGFLDDPDLATVRRFVLATRDAHAVYRPLGFVPVDPTRWMERRPPDSAWQEP